MDNENEKKPSIFVTVPNLNQSLSAQRTKSPFPNITVQRTMKRKRNFRKANTVKTLLPPNAQGN